ncbi:MAG TPA: M28 family peptidase [Terriglobales bacterium]|nr:M28 family peptidase [Terriglobales bacterium]
MEVQAAQARQARALEWIRQLTHFRPRFAGTPSERAAAEAVTRWLSDLGIEETEVRSVASAPRPGLVLAMHASLALLALCLGGLSGAILAAAAAFSFFSEVRRRRPVLSRWLPAPASVNVVGRAGAKEPKQRVVLSAHIDAAQAGVMFSKALADSFARMSRSRGESAAPLGPLLVPELAIGGAAVLAIAAWLGGHGFLLSALVLITAVVLAIVTLLTLQWAFSRATPGANDNASAVAAMLLAAERLLAAMPADTELWVVGTGAEEVGCCGMKGFVDSQSELPAATTWFVNFECVGGGHLHYIESEGLARRTDYPPVLVDLARRMALTGRFGEVTPTKLMAGTDGHVPARHGYPTLSLISLEDNGVPRNYHRIEDTVENVDAEMVVRAADFGAEVALAALHGAAGPLFEKAPTWQDPY